MIARATRTTILLAGVLGWASCTTDRRVGIIIDTTPPVEDAEVVADATDDVALPPDDTGTAVGDDDAGTGGALVVDAAADAPPPAHFSKIPAGKPLPTEASCAARVRRTGKEARPDNASYNTVIPTAAELSKLTPWGDPRGFDNMAIPLGKRVTGNFTGTTDEILQWAACKWGFDEDFVRADAYQANGWHQASVSGWTDMSAQCPSDGPVRNGPGGVMQCAQVFSLFGITWQFHKSAWPMFHESTPFTVDYALGLQRVCFEGWVSYMKGWGPPDKMYGPNDEFGCAAAFYTGGWYDDTTNQQVTHIRDTLASKPWLQGN